MISQAVVFQSELLPLLLLVSSPPGLLLLLLQPASLLNDALAADVGRVGLLARIRHLNRVAADVEADAPAAAFRVGVFPAGARKKRGVGRGGGGCDWWQRIMSVSLHFRKIPLACSRTLNNGMPTSMLFYPAMVSAQSTPHTFQSSDPPPARPRKGRSGDALLLIIEELRHILVRVVKFCEEREGGAKMIGAARSVSRGARVA
jgi:hypothetical protein